MEAAPIRVTVEVSAKMTLRNVLIVLVSAITSASFARCYNHGRARHRVSLVSTSALLLFCKSDVRPASHERLSAIMSTGHEAELHSPAGRARRRGGIPERCSAPQLSQSSRGAGGDAIGDQPGGTHIRGTRRRGAVHPHHAQRRLD